MEYITIPGSCKKIGKGAFAGATSLREISLSEKIKEIEEMAFAGCSNLADITIPSQTETIGDAAFSMCIRFENIVLPSNIKTLGSHAFSLCSNLKTVSFNENLQSIGEGAFSDCYMLSDVTLPDQIKEIGESAFENCYAMNEILIPNSVISLGNKAFGSVEFKNSVTNRQLNPFSIAQETFDDNTYNNIALKVPSGTRANYEMLSGWNNFKNIIEEEIEGGEYILKVLYNDGGYLTYNGNKIFSEDHIIYDDSKESLLKIIPYESYNVGSVSLNGNNVSQNNNEVIISGINGNSTLECEFKIKEYTLRIVEAEANSYSELLVEHGASPRIKIQSVTGKDLLSVRINGETATDKITNGDYYKMEPIKENTTIVISSDEDVAVKNSNIKTYVRYWNIENELFIESDKKINRIEAVNFTGQIIHTNDAPDYSYIIKLEKQNSYIINISYEDGETETFKYQMK